MNEFNFNSYGNSKQTISYCEVDKCNAVVELKQQLKAKEQECEELKKQIESDKDLISDIAKHNYQLFQELDQIKADNDSLKSELMQTNCYLDADKETIDQLKAENEKFKKAEEYDSRYNDLQAEIDCGNAIIEKYEKCLEEMKKIAKGTSSFKSIFKEPFAEVMKHCPYLNDNVFCAENKTSCVGCICARKQAVYYGEKVAYLEQILQKISEVTNEN